MTDPSYAFSKQLDGVSVDEAIEKLSEALKANGFGVLTKIDVKETLKKKIDVDFRPYVILGACNPKLAHKALQGESFIGLLLPCNVLVREDSDDRVHVDFMDPESVLSLVKDPGVAPLAADVKSRLQRVLETL